MILSLFNKDIHEPQRYIWEYIYVDWDWDSVNMNFFLWLKEIMLLWFELFEEYFLFQL